MSQSPKTYCWPVLMFSHPYSSPSSLPHTSLENSRTKGHREGRQHQLPEGFLFSTAFWLPLGASHFLDFMSLCKALLSQEVSANRILSCDRR